MAKKQLIPKSKAKTAYGLLSEIRKLILEEPKRYNQELWRIALSDLTPEEALACGTVCCVAGWVETLKFKHVTPAMDAFEFSDSKVFKRARRVLGLSKDQAVQLFRSNALDDIDADAKNGTHRYARAGAKHIWAFQQRHAAQLKAKRV